MPAEYAAFGAIAQLGERYNGIVEVVGSIPSGSTTNEGLVRQSFYYDYVPIV